MGKSMFFSGDTYYDPPALEKLYLEKKIFSKERYEELAKRDFSKYDLILHEAGIAPIHTPQENFLKWDPELRDKLYLFHCNCDSVKDKDKLKVVKRGLENTLILVNEPPIKLSSKNNLISHDPFKSNLQLLAGVDIVSWIPVRRMLDLLEVIHTINYRAGQAVISADSYGTRFYFVKRGRLRVYLDNPNNSFEKFIYPGDYFGESAIFEEGYRLANVETETDVTLLEIEKFDFLWVFSNNSIVNSENNSMGSSIIKGEDLAPEMQLIKNLSNLRKARLGEFINENKFVKGLNESQKCKINMFIREKPTKAGEVLWKKGNKCGFCFFVRNGKYQVSSFSTIYILIFLDNQT